MEEHTNFLNLKPNDVSYSLCQLSNLVFEVTDACNLSCKYCGYSDLYTRHDNREDKFMHFDQAKAVIDYLVNFWKSHSSPAFPKRLNIGFYGGEPLLNTKFIREVIDYIEKQDNFGRTLSYSMTTNGLLLDKYIDFLVEKNFSLLISLDGDEYAHSHRIDKQGNNSFTQVYQNARLILEHFQGYFNRHVRFNAVLHNKNDIGPLYDFFIDHFGKAPTISSLSRNGVNKEKLCMFDELCNNYGESFLKVQDSEKIVNENFSVSPKLSRFYRQFEHKSENIFNDYQEMLIDKGKVGIVPTGTCIPFAKKMFITVNGKILQCERIDHKYFLGIIKNNRVILDFDEIAKSFNKDVFKFISQCTSCSIKARCNRCIYQLNTLDGTDDVCLSYMNEKKDYKIDLSPLRTHPNLLHRIMYELKVAN